MADVFVTTYEMVGAAAETAREHFQAVRDTRHVWWEFARANGAQGFRPGHHGYPPRGLIFAGTEPPTGWRYQGRPDSKTVEAVPHKGTKAGKLAAAGLAALPQARQDSDLIGAFGWHEMPMDGHTLYFGTASELPLPAPRYFLRLPRFEGDGWEPEPDLIEMAESAFLRAVEQHNAAAREARAKVAA